MTWNTPESFKENKTKQKNKSHYYTTFIVINSTYRLTSQAISSSFFHCLFLSLNSLSCFQMCQYPFYSVIQGTKLHLPGRQCGKDLSAGDQNFRCGRQQATNIVTADYYVQRRRLRIKFPDICQQALKFCSVDIFKMKLKRVSRQRTSISNKNK